MKIKPESAFVTLSLPLHIDFDFGILATSYKTNLSDGNNRLFVYQLDIVTSNSWTFKKIAITCYSANLNLRVWV